MSNYYEYRGVKVMIAHELMKMDDWKVYGYSPDQSDSMTDYYNPAHWGGVAEKNGYILCIDVYGAREPEEIREYNHSGFSYDGNIVEKIKKLEAMTIERGASESEAKSAKITIERLQKKQSEEAENRNKYIVVGMIPGHMANPPRCNWHIEKDGLIVAKGNGILKYNKVSDYFTYERNMKDLEKFRNLSEDEYIKDKAKTILNHSHYHNTEEEALKSAENNYKTLLEDIKLVDKFNDFINKLNTTCGCLVGEGEIEQYEKVTVTEYKKENKIIETLLGEVKEGQCFVLKVGFNYGRSKGSVYRIHRTECNGKEYFHAYKLNGKLTKECTGIANRSNYWSCITDESFLKWIEKGSIAWCELQEVKTPYAVEKVVKKTIKTGNKQTKNSVEEDHIEVLDVQKLTFEVTEDIDTRTNERIYLVKIVEKLSREEYLQVNKYIKNLGGYYSKFKHGFIFKEEPIKLLKTEPTQTFYNTESNPSQEKPKKVIEYDIEEGRSPFDNKKVIYLVRIKNELSKQDFEEVKQRLAKLNGFYSSLKNGFIFKYNPQEKLII